VSDPNRTFGTDLAGTNARIGSLMLDRELGAFLRSRREALTPADVGLPPSPRRRTPGLRRAEVATLAGISVDYLVRLEQGRDTHPSSQVLAALAQALQLGPEDLDQLSRFSVLSNGKELCPAAAPVSRAVRPTVAALLERLEPTPAYVINRLTDVLAWTTGYAQLVDAVGVLDDPAPNLLRYTFTDPRARVSLPDWEATADARISHVQAVHHGGDELDGLVTSLRDAAGATFSERWDAQPSVRGRFGVERLVHPEVGELRVAFETLQLPDADDQRLVVFLPADDATAAAFDVLNGRRPGGLRAVTG
jgi:transcriptional regulator with XRE-family HTH domain